MSLRIISITYFPTVVPLRSCFLSCRSFVVNAIFSTDLIVYYISGLTAIFPESIVFFRSAYHKIQGNFALKNTKNDNRSKILKIINPDKEPDDSKNSNIVYLILSE
jgi:hypothetical protein